MPSVVKPQTKAYPPKIAAATRETILTTDRSNLSENCERFSLRGWNRSRCGFQSGRPLARDFEFA